PARAVPDPRRRQRRAGLPLLHPPPPDGDRGLVQGLSRPDQRRSLAPFDAARGLRAPRDGRPRGARLVGADLKMPAVTEFADIQGLARTGFGTLKSAVYLLLDVADSAAARAWLRKAPATPAGARVDEALQI